MRQAVQADNPARLQTFRARINGSASINRE